MTVFTTDGEDMEISFSKEPECDGGCKLSPYDPIIDGMLCIDCMELHEKYFDGPTYKEIRKQSLKLKVYYYQKMLNESKRLLKELK